MLSLKPRLAVPSSAPSEFKRTINQGTDGFELYRIPAIVKSKSNTLLAFAEARKLEVMEIAEI